MDFLFPYERSMMLQDAHDLLADTQLSVPVTYRAFISRSFTPSTGGYTPNYSDTSLRVIRNALPMREVVASDGLFEQGDLRFIFDRASLVPEPTKDDRIVDGVKVYDVIDWDSDPIAAMWRIVARKVA